MPSLSPTFLLVAALVLLFSYLNGVTGSASLIAPVLSTRALGPRQAVWLVTLVMCAAPFLLGVAVARSFGAGILRPDLVTVPVLLAATFSASAWSVMAWRLQIPSSSSHALIGGLLGAGLADVGLSDVQWRGVLGVMAALFFSPVLGLLAGYVITKLLYRLGQAATPKIGGLVKKAQIVTAMALALSYGANDGQKTIGLLALALAVTSKQPITIPNWISAVTMAAVALGTLTGGWGTITTLGGRFYKIQPIHGLGAQIAAACVTFSAALVGGPVSSTQVISTALLGAGAADRINKVRWGVATDILWTWLLTIPATALLAGGVFFIVRGWF